MGIIAGNSKTINVSEHEILNNDWGYRGTEARPVRIFRINTSSSSANTVNINTVDNQNDECDTCY